MIAIGDKIRIQRITKSYSQEYMAFMLDISQAAYSKLERDETEMSLRRVYEIAEILEISPFELMPKPKYGHGINQEFIWRTMNKLRKFWSADIKRKIATKPHPVAIGERDTSNS
jgi:transcriptional regulator with XRE-family HTH domain